MGHMDEVDLHHLRKLDYLADMGHAKAKELGRQGHSEGSSADECPECNRVSNEVRAERLLSEKQFGK
jgi:hypothetical protein